MNKKLAFLKAIESLKTIERFNLISNKSRAESVAEHIWHLLMMAYLFAEDRKDLDKWKSIEMCMVHDLVEVYAGDTSVWAEDRKSPEEKHRLEAEAAKKIFSFLPDNIAERLHCLWEEYEAGKTAESKFVHALDKLQPCMQRVISGDEGMKIMKIDRAKLDQTTKPKFLDEDAEMKLLWDILGQEAEQMELFWNGEASGE